MAESAPSHGGRPASEGLDRDTLVIAGVVMLGTVMSILDATVVNVAIDGEKRTEGHQMTSNADSGGRVLGSLPVADGTGIVRIQDRFDTNIDELWSAVTDPHRLAHWLGEIEATCGSGACSGPGSFPADGKAQGA